jgi:Tfp pilus assembly protein PilE
MNGAGKGLSYRPVGLLGRRDARQKAGGTFVEVMMACVVLTVIASAGGAYFAQSSGILSVQRNRTAALAVANGRMEELRGTTYGNLTNLMVSGTNWFTRSGSSWVVSSSEVSDTFNIGSFPQKLTTVLIATSVSGGSPDALIMTVEATYRDPESVSLTTIYAP